MSIIIISFNRKNHAFWFRLYNFCGYNSRTTCLWLHQTCGSLCSSFETSDKLTKGTIQHMVPFALSLECITLKRWNKSRRGRVLDVMQYAAFVTCGLVHGSILSNSKHMLVFSLCSIKVTSYDSEIQH